MLKLFNTSSRFASYPIEDEGSMCYRSDAKSKLEVPVSTYNPKYKPKERDGGFFNHEA
jgi:hypothetical protein